MKRLIGVLAIATLVAAGCAAPDSTADADGAASGESASPATGDSTTTPSDLTGGTSDSTPTDSDFGTSGDVAPGESTTTLPGATPTSTEPGASSSTYEGPYADLVAAALADLSARLGIDGSAITVVSAEAMVWGDGSLGCPNPDMAYTQVQVEGSKIVLTYSGVTYAYHSGGERSPFLCVPQKSGDSKTTTTLIDGSFDE